MSGLGHDGDPMIIHRMLPPSLASFRSLGTAACASSLQGKAQLLSARRVFDAMPTTRVRADLNIGQALSVTVHHMLYPITLSVLHQVFGAYGMVLKLSVVGKLVYCQVLVQCHTCESAAQAMKTLQGRYIYDGCCRLDIKGAELSELSVLENSSSMLSKPPLVTNTPKQVPTFDGTDMNRWRTDCEGFFELNKIPRVLWIIAAEMNMVGDAALWLQAYKSRHVSAAWEDLCAAMLQAFGPGTDQQLPDIAENCQDIDENKILNVQSAPSQDSMCSQTQVSPVHCPISKMNEGELGLDSADEIFRERPFKDMVWDEELAESMVTHIGGSSLFLEHIMDTHQELEGDVDKRGNLQQLLSKEMQQHSTNSDTLVLPWDPEKQENGINGLFSWKFHAETRASQCNLCVVSRSVKGVQALQLTSDHVWDKRPPWTSGGFSPGHNGHPNLGRMPPWRQRAFSPWKSGIRDAHCVIDKAPPWNKKDIHHGNFATRGDPLLLNKIPSWQGSAFSPWLGNIMWLILGQQEGTEGCQIDLLLLNNGEQDFGPTSSFSVQASPFVFTIAKWQQRHSEHCRRIKKFENPVLRAMGIFQREQRPSLALIYFCQMSLVLNCTSLKPEVKVHTSVAFGLGTNADVQITKEPTYFPSQAGNSLLFSTAYHCWHLESRGLEKFDIIWLLQVHTELYRHCDLFFVIQLASNGIPVSYGFLLPK